MKSFEMVLDCVTHFGGMRRYGWGLGFEDCGDRGSGQKTVLIPLDQRGLLALAKLYQAIYEPCLRPA